MEERKVCCVLLASSWGCFLQNHTDTIFSLLLPALQTDLTDWIGKSDNSDDHLGCNDGERAKGERSTTVIGKRDGTDSADESVAGSLDTMNLFFESSAKTTAFAWEMSKSSTTQIVEQDIGTAALVELFDLCIEEHSPVSDTCKNDETGDCDANGSSRLTMSADQRRLSMEIATSVVKDPKRKAAIERVCPDWMENIQVAMVLTTDQEQLGDALSNVRRARGDLNDMKETVHEAFLDRLNTLDLQENSIDQKLPTECAHRVREPEELDRATGECGMEVGVDFLREGKSSVSFQEERAHQ
jgi:hypothetical protein